MNKLVVMIVVFTIFTIASSALAGSELSALSEELITLTPFIPGTP